MAHFPRKNHRESYLPALLALAAGVLFALTLYPHYVQDNDVGAYLFQARTFAEGRLAARSPDLTEPFHTWFVITDAEGRMFSRYPPGHALFLAASLRLFGTARVVPPLAMAGCVVLLYFLLLELYDRRTASLGAWLLLLSPFFLFAGSTLLSHATNTALVALFLLLYVKYLKRPRALLALGSGAALGMAFLTRPYTAVLVGLVAAGWLPVHARLERRGRRARDPAAGAQPRGTKSPGFLRRAPVFLIGAAPFLAAYLVYNQLLMGDPFRPPFLASGFVGADRPDVAWLGSWGPFVERLGRTRWALGEMNHWAAPFPYLFQVVFLYVALVLRRRQDVLLMLFLLAIVVGHAFYFGTGDFWVTGIVGPLYYFAGLLFLAGANARFLLHVHAFFRERSPERVYRWGLVAVAVFVAVSFAWRMGPRYVALRNHARARAADVRVLEQGIEEPALVFLPAAHIGHPWGQFLNAPSFDDPVVFARDLGAERNHELHASLYFERRAYVFFDGRPHPLRRAVPFVRHWLLLGPFEGPLERLVWRAEKLDPALPGPQVGEGDLGRVWQPHYAKSAYVDLADDLMDGEETSARAYAHTYVYMGHETPARILFGSDDAIRIWVNEEKVADVFAVRGAAMDEDTASCVLGSGWNRVLVESGQDHGGWGFFLRFTDLYGNPLESLHYQPEPPVNPEPVPFVRRWALAGPFFGEFDQVFARDFVGERSALPDPESSSPGGAPPDDLPRSRSHGEPPRWRAIVSPSPEIDLHDHLRAPRPAAAYAHTYVRSDVERSVLLRMGSDDGIKVWLNGGLVFGRNEVRGARPDQDRVEAALRAGWNSVLVKVTQMRYGWEFYFRISDLDGAPVPALWFQAEKPPGDELRGLRPPTGSAGDPPSESRGSFGT
jgi:hypothetical protein